MSGPNLNSPIKCVLQLKDIKFQRHGGGVIQFEFGGDSLESLQKLQVLLKKGDLNIAVAMVPFHEDGVSPIVKADDVF